MDFTRQRNWPVQQMASLSCMSIRSFAGSLQSSNQTFESGSNLSQAGAEQGSLARQSEDCWSL
jgi:hypothetical protein